mmetsp:Transcript_17451/g.40611  ORF Transcript_17451/g.40611 Transcript_17451/m.40611 type:complete len:841 (+) Transcript_17451:85-2607(+)
MSGAARRSGSSLVTMFVAGTVGAVGLGCFYLPFVADKDSLRGLHEDDDRKLKEQYQLYLQELKQEKQQLQQQQQEQEAKNEYKVGCIVYKKFEPHWYFGFISKVFPEEGWYKVFYEDGDAEDVDADELDRTAVRWESGQLAHINTTEDDLDAEPPTFQLRDDYQHPTGTSDIILQQPELFGSLDRDFLNKYIEKRLYQDRYGKDDAPGKPLFPLYPLGTIVYMYFQPEWFFGYVALIDVNTQLYGVDYEDGDREELSQQEISDAVVVLRGNVATTSITPQALSREDWLQQPLALRSVEFPGSLSIVNHNTLFSCLDREALDEYIADRCYPNKKKRAKEKQLSRTRAKHRINSSTDQSVNVDEYTAECHRPTKKQKSRPQKRAKPGIAMSTVESVDVKVKGRFSEAVLNFFRLMHERQSMWVRRNRNELIVTESGERVLSTDPILTYYHFCNVYRELDRGTAYFHSHVLNMRYASSEKGEDSSWDEKLWLETVLWASYVYRQVNRIETFQALGGIPDIDEIEKFGHRAESHAQTVVFFTGAHQTTNVSNLLMRLRTYQGEDGVKVFRNTASKLYSAQSVKEAINILQSLKGIGVFFAWQIVCDLRESQCLHHLKSDDYCQLGPGAKKGLDAILGCGRKDYLQEAQKLVGIQEEAYRQLGLQFPYWQPRKLSIKEIEHFLCEMSKYDSIDSDGTGRSYKTRSRMDVKTPCPVCNTDKSESRCDTCFTFFCTECSPKGTESHASFLCTWCVKFNGLAPKHTPVSDSSPISSLSLMQEEVAVDRDTMYKGTRKSVSAPAEDSMEIVPTPFATGGKAEDAMDLTSKTPEAGVKSEDAMGLSIFHC